MTGNREHTRSAVEEMESNPATALELAAARLAVDVSALLAEAFEASGIQARELAKRLGVTGAGFAGRHPGSGGARHRLGFGGRPCLLGVFLSLR
jgi:hypothetical protein